MNLEELITLIYKKINSGDKQYTKAEIREIYKCFIEILEEKLEEEAEGLNKKKSVKLNIPLIGKFNIVKQESYLGRNPRSKEKVKIPANNRIYYSPYKSIKDAANR